MRQRRVDSIRDFERENIIPGYTVKESEEDCWASESSSCGVQMVRFSWSRIRLTMAQARRAIGERFWRKEASV